MIALVLFTCLSPLACQDSLDTRRARTGAQWEPVVLRISELLDSMYVYPEVAARMGADLVGRFEAGEFDGVQGTGAFARAVTDILQTVSVGGVDPDSSPLLPPILSHRPPLKRWV